MSIKIHLLSHAKADLREARDYYDSIMPGLGRRFTNDFENILEKIEAKPFTYSSRMRALEPPT